MTREEKKEELIGLFCTGAIFIGDLIDECFDFGQQHPHWISVEDELPKNRESILFTDGGCVYSGRYYGGRYYGDKGDWVDFCEVSTLIKDVTHWMPMPAPPKEETKWTEHTLQRDKDGFLVGEVSDLDVYLPFEVHDNKHDTWEVIEDDSALVDWSGDIDTKPRYDRIRTIRQVVSKTETSASEKPTYCGEKGGEQ